MSDPIRAVRDGTLIIRHTPAGILVEGEANGPTLDGAPIDEERAREVAAMVEEVVIPFDSADIEWRLVAADEMLAAMDREDAERAAAEVAEREQRARRLDRRLAEDARARQRTEEAAAVGLDVTGPRWR